MIKHIRVRAEVLKYYRKIEVLHSSDVWEAFLSQTPQIWVKKEKQISLATKNLNNSYIKNFNKVFVRCMGKDDKA